LLDLGSTTSFGIELNLKISVFQLDSRLILKKIGGLTGKDQEAVKNNLKKLLSLDESK